MRRFSQNASQVLPALFVSILLAACGGGGSSTAIATSSVGVSDPVTAHYTIGGTLSGLSSNESLTLLNDGSDSTSVGANESFTFSSAIAAGGSYNVTVGRQPVGHLCTVSNGTGSNLSASVTNVAVNCVASSAKVLASLSSAYGTTPQRGLFQASDGNFYGAASEGGSYNSGSIFRVTPAGEKSILFSFDFDTSGSGLHSALVRGPDGDLFGTTPWGGSFGGGTAFKISTSGAFTLLHNFAGNPSPSSNPYGRLVLASDGNFYGTTLGAADARYGYGTVFQMTPTGVVTLLKTFTSGENPIAGLVQARDGYLYGTFRAGGANGVGGVFKISLDGTSYAVVHDFDGDREGVNPMASLTQATDGCFYGVLNNGGEFGKGAVFRMTPAGEVTIVHAFSGGVNDGSYPYDGPLLQANDGNLYGVTLSGGTNYSGVLYRLTLAGAFTLMHSFGSGTDGQVPNGSLTQGTDGKIYGSTLLGGASGGGTVFVY